MRKTIKLSAWRVFLKEPPQRWREPALQSNLHPAARRASSQTSPVTKHFVSSLWADLDLLEHWSTQQSTLLPHVTDDAAGRQMCLHDAPAPGPPGLPRTPPAHALGAQSYLPSCLSGIRSQALGLCRTDQPLPLSRTLGLWAHKTGSVPNPALCP